MNILLITSEFPPFSLGGVSVHSNQLSKKICEDSENKVIVITFMNEQNKQDLEVEYNINEIIVRVNIFGKTHGKMDEEEQYIIQNAIMQKGVDFLQKNKLLNNIDLITLHGNFLANTALRVKDIIDVPLIYHSHSTYSFDVLKDKEEISSSVIVSAEYKLCRTSEKIIVVSSYLKNLIVRYFSIDPDKINIIGKGIDIKTYDNVIINKKSDDFRILFVGRISPEKGIEVLLMAFKLLLRKPSFNGKLYIIGAAINQDYLNEIKNKINLLSLSRKIIFLGSKAQNEIVREFKSSDLVVVPSHNETFGRVAIEAMAAKIPVIVSDVGGLGPLVDNRITGFKFRDGDYIGLMNQILYVYNHPEVCKSVTQSAYKNVRDLYTFDNIYKKTLEVYNYILEEFHENTSSIASS